MTKTVWEAWAADRRQSIIWINADQIQRRILAARGVGGGGGGDSIIIFIVIVWP